MNAEEFFCVHRRKTILYQWGRSFEGKARPLQGRENGFDPRGLHFMKVIKRENGIELVPETDFEKECLSHIYSKGISKIEWTDSWERKGNLKLEGRPQDDWGS